MFDTSGWRPRAWTPTCSRTQREEVSPVAESQGRQANDPSRGEGGQEVEWRFLSRITWMCRFRGSTPRDVFSYYNLAGGVEERSRSETDSLALPAKGPPLPRFPAQDSSVPHIRTYQPPSPSGRTCSEKAASCSRIKLCRVSDSAHMCHLRACSAQMRLDGGGYPWRYTPRS